MYWICSPLETSACKIEDDIRLHLLYERCSRSFRKQVRDQVFSRGARLLGSTVCDDQIGLGVGQRPSHRLPNKA